MPTAVKARSPLPAMHPECRYVIVVPVHHEEWQRLTRQLSSLQQQDGIRREQFEVIYVINNSPGCSNEVRNHNQRAMHTLRVTRELGQVNVHLIDASSRGLEIPDCNVGKARDLGVREACSRFEGIGRDGWIINTDADCHFDDPAYFRKLSTLISEYPDAVAFNGGLEYEFSPDLKDRSPDLFQRMYRMRLRIGWHRLAEAIASGRTRQDYRSRMKMSGAHMIAPVSSIRAIGGMPQIAAGEDHAFYNKLSTLAENLGKPLPYIRHLLTVVTAARLSERTPESMAAVVRSMKMNQPFRASDLMPLLQDSSDHNSKVEVTYAEYRRVLDALSGLPGAEETEQELNLLFGRLDRHMRRLKKQSANVFAGALAAAQN